jgi:cysteinyl-tRNA synthetase
MLRLYNSISKQKEFFKSIKPQEISMYVCGVTVYDHCHLGHARCMVVFDMMVRYFKYLGYQVNFVRNITDVDDKIIRKAQESGKQPEMVANTFIHSMQEDAISLNIEFPNCEPKATDYIPQMIEMIKTLIDKNYAYVAKNGDVCFSVEKFQSYGKLSRQDLSQLVSGARIDVVEEKTSPLDFVLWKRSKEHEPSWSSPWGEGRPGWHIECSAMASCILGTPIDIHGGGLDLQFPHHENEIAQSEAASDTTFANYWLHVGLLQLNHEKMAKSTGNFLTIKAALKRYPAEVLKLFFMSGHYRSPLNFSDENLQQFHKTLQRLYQTLNQFKSTSTEIDKSWLKCFEEKMNDDFNTPEALAVLFELNSLINKDKRHDLIVTLKFLANLLGFLHLEPAQFLQANFGTDSSLSDEEINHFITERKNARNNKDFQKADDIRKQLVNHGIELEDKIEGTTWRRVVD